MFGTDKSNVQDNEDIEHLLDRAEEIVLNSPEILQQNRVMHVIEVDDMDRLREIIKILKRVI